MSVGNHLCCKPRFSCKIHRCRRVRSSRLDRRNRLPFYPPNSSGRCRAIAKPLCSRLLPVAIESRMDECSDQCHMPTVFDAAALRAQKFTYQIQRPFEFAATLDERKFVLLQSNLVIVGLGHIAPNRPTRLGYRQLCSADIATAACDRHKNNAQRKKWRLHFASASATRTIDATDGDSRG